MLDGLWVCCTNTDAFKDVQNFENIRNLVSQTRQVVDAVRDFDSCERNHGINALGG